MMYVACGSYLKCADARIASAASGSLATFSARPSATMSLGTGVVSVHTLFSCFLGLVTYPPPLTAAQLVVPAGTLLQYSIWMAAHDVPPRLLKNEVT